MKLKIKKSTLLQYMLIYLMIILNQSHIYRIFIQPNPIVGLTIIAVLVVFLFCNYRRTSTRAFLMCIFLVASVAFVRFTQGGIGITVCYEMIAKILVVYAAILVDVDKFWTRFVKVVVFFASISILGWLQQIIGLDIMTKIAPAYEDFAEKVSWNTGTQVVTKLHVYGILLYTTSEYEPMRNVGIFTEPGIYQMVLNSAIVILLFFSKNLDLSTRKIKKYTLICVIALLSTQSTSGYFGLAIIFLGVMINTTEETKTVKQYIFILCTIGVVVLVGDLSIRGESSLLFEALLSKVFSDGGQFDVNASTGMYRMASIAMSIKAMIEHPLGLGFDKWVQFSAVNELAGAGGWPFKLGAMLGVFPLAVTMYWIFSPLKYIKRYIVEIIVIVFLYFNTSLAQTSAFYPVLIVVPLYLSITKCDLKLKESDN